jgi:HAD superfamily hydrolase (TIGR01490 family)
VTAPTAVAAFDVDGTLARGDCVVPFLRRVAGVRGLVLAVIRQPLALGMALAHRDRDRMKELVVGAAHRGRSVDVVTAIGEEFAAEIARGRLREDVLARLRWHQQQGHRTVLVSASLKAYLDPLARSLGIDHVLCTDVATADGRYEGRLAGQNCRAEEKVARLRVWLDEEGLGSLPVWAYGDSKSDEPMLAAADHPVRVGADTVLAVPTGFPG